MTLGKKLLENTPNLAYQLDDYEISKAIAVSIDSEHWSGGFSIESLEDFQIKILSELSDREKELNIYEKG